MKSPTRIICFQPGRRILCCAGNFGNNHKAPSEDRLCQSKILTQNPKKSLLEKLTLHPSQSLHLLYRLGLCPFLMLVSWWFWTMGATPWRFFCPRTSLFVHSLSLHRSGVLWQALQVPQGSALHPSHSWHRRPLEPLLWDSPLGCERGNPVEDRCGQRMNNTFSTISVNMGSLQRRAAQR